MLLIHGLEPKAKGLIDDFLEGLPALAGAFPQVFNELVVQGRTIPSPFTSA